MTETKCDHQCSGNCRRVGCHCACGEYHDIAVTPIAPTVEPTEKKLKRLPDTHPSISPLPDTHSSPTETGWEEKIPFQKHDKQCGHATCDSRIMIDFIRETITQALAEQKARMVEDLKKICNKSKTERGLAIALGNFIKALSK